MIGKPRDSVPRSSGRGLAAFCCRSLRCLPVLRWAVDAVGARGVEPVCAVYGMLRNLLERAAAPTRYGGAPILQHVAAPVVALSAWRRGGFFHQCHPIMRGAAYLCLGYGVHATFPFALRLINLETAVADGDPRLGP